MLFFCGGGHFLLGDDVLMCAVHQVTSQSPIIKSKTLDPQNIENIFTVRNSMWYVSFHANIIFIFDPFKIHLN